jgi:hypothetical protein
MFEDSANLFKRDAGEPLHELGYLCAILQVLKQRGNRHTRAPEYPGTTDALRVPFNGSASRPIDHKNSTGPFDEATFTPGPGIC